MSHVETFSVGRQFHTPMSFSPRVAAKPSPSREEIWKEQLGIEGSDIEEDQSEASNTDDEPEADQITCGTVTAMEMQALQTELEQKNKQREELLIKLKTLTDKTAGYKSRLQKAEHARKSQLKIMKKTHETQLQIKNNLIQSLEDVVEELEEKLSELESSKENSEPGLPPIVFKPSGIRKLVKSFSDLNDEKNALYESFLSTQSELDLVKEEHKSSVSRLTSEVLDLEEKHEALQREYNNIQNGALSNARQKDEDKIQNQEQEISKLKKKIQTLEYEIDSKEKGVREMIRKHEDDMMHVRRSLREAETKYSNLAATPPKIKKVSVVSEETKKELDRMIVENQELKSVLSKTRSDANAKISALEDEVKSLSATIADANAREQKVKNESLTLKNALKDKEREVADVAREQQEKIYKLRNEVRHYKGEVDHFREKLANEMRRHMSEKENMEKELREQLKKEAQTSQLKLERLKRQMVNLGRVVEEIRRQYKELKIDTLKMCTSIKPLVRDTQNQIVKRIEGIDDKTKELVAKYKREMTLRKRYHNELVELKGNIRVYCRVRPKIKEDGGGKMAENVVTFDDDDAVLSVYSKGSTKQFEMERVFRPESTQEQVFAEVRNLIISCIDGYNVCIFAYGQTGSGKTFTMEGPSHDPGINQRTLQLLFEETGERATDWDYNISVSVMEIYNEMLRDLLGQDPSAKLDIKQGREGLYVPGLFEVEVSNVDEVNEVFALGKRNRATATTDMNEHSSRSHALLCVKVMGINRTTGARTAGKLNLVDLAGSERVSKSGSEGARMKEAQSINKSLSSLGDVIHSLKNKSSHIPYRNSKLTYLLQESLGGDSKTLMVVQVSPVEKNVGETMCSLNFAQRVRTVELGQATRKAETAEVAQLKDRLRECEGRLNSPARASPRNPQTPNGKYQR